MLNLDLTSLTDSSYKYKAVILDLNVPDYTIQLNPCVKRCKETKMKEAGLFAAPLMNNSG